MQKLAVKALREASFMQRHNDIALPVARRGDDDIRRALAASGCRQIDIPLADRGAALLRLGNQLQDRTAEGNQLIQFLAGEKPGADREELLGGRIDGQHLQIPPDQQNGHGEHGENLAEAGMFDFRGFTEGFHNLPIK
jgi:hypothetical protein